ncbi:MAG: TlyA family rRNA (cytidine-2'-O)-methyltransferase [Chloroflexi bacterium HGW-Chloroflexi-3]|nr:MAG: TlyA family rRNA (cytidine-2'-O)-methyltransferase [Chloroflexi bacterium HGW-Chloroflexi-3]
MAKIRVDIYLYEHKMVESRSLAQRLVMAGEILVNGEMVLKPSQQIDDKAKVEIIKGPKFVSRGGEKLEVGLKSFRLVNLADRICVDVGSSTGGFTDCLLQNGAKKVYAIDVGFGILHWKLRNDPRVVVMERTNARNVVSLPDAIDLVTVDASFISLKVLLPVIKNWLHAESQIVMLIKPQFEAGRKDAAKGAGVIRDPDIHRKILLETLDFAIMNGFRFEGLIISPLRGPKGNIEFLAHLSVGAEDARENIEEVVDSIISDML